ncbi:hypothetical protein [Flavobacterium branchiicola]|uniref:Uncharacterized protein n=1 Tax=Flavobacterium branchiicola TaxID=1114875 RepID=A0ABV9PDB7_9FLAO|nr:hypothetical protein [Flavobacterium branchiicola]MBS7253176.1 hypothetical protein [Flavobacterium branchiicola]
MKNIIKRFFLYLLLLSSIIVNAGPGDPCPLATLVNDLSTSSAEFKILIKEHNSFDAWLILNNEAPILRTNIDELKLVSKNLDEVKNAGGYLKWKSLKGVAIVYNNFGKPIDFGGDILKTAGMKLNILGRVGPTNNTIGTLQLFNELKLKGVPENEMSGLFQNIPKEWNELPVMEQNTKYWKEINKVYIDNIIASNGDIRFIHDPRLPVNISNLVSDIKNSKFREKCEKEGLVKIRTFMNMEYEYLLSKGYILQETGLMIKP